MEESGWKVASLHFNLEPQQIVSIWSILDHKSNSGPQGFIKEM